MSVLIIAECLKCNGSGKQINYRQGKNVESRCANCKGHGFKSLKNKPIRDNVITDVSFYNGKHFIKADFYCNEGFDVESCFYRFNEKEHKHGQRIATFEMRQKQNKS